MCRCTHQGVAAAASGKAARKTNMKSLAVAAVAVSLIATFSLASAQSQRAASGTRSVVIPLRLPTLHGVRAGRVYLPMQTADQATPTPTTPTNSYPDAVTVLQTAFTKYSLYNYVHFVDTIDAEQTGVLKITAAARANAACHAMAGTVSGARVVSGTSQQSKVHYKFVEKKNKAWKRNLLGRSHKWARSKSSSVESPFKSDIGPGLVTNPLACAPLPPDQANIDESLKDLVNLGPDTYNGSAVWHIQGTVIVTDASGTTTDYTADFLVTQDQYLLVDQTITFQDASQGVSIVSGEQLSKFGTKWKLSIPKVGSTRP